MSELKRCNRCNAPIEGPDNTTIEMPPNRGGQILDICILCSDELWERLQREKREGKRENRN